jgi:ornithine cyclodeaminase/alanine dehydrogenase-like protein (mu-crystallin family)
MALLLTENDVTRLLTMPEAIEAVEAAFAELGTGKGTANHPRQRFFLPHGVLHHMAATLPGKGYMGTKTYTSFPDGTRFYVMLFSSNSGELLALIEGNRLGQVRTGATTGVAAKYMARDDVTLASLIGAGWQAEAQAEALVAVRPHIREFQVYSRHYVPRERFCQKMTRKLSVRFTPFDSAEAAVRGTQVVITATTAREPVVFADWLSPGDFVAAVGANRLTAREVDEEVLARSAVVAVDDLTQAKTEAAELIFANERRRFNWDQAVALSEVVSGWRPGRTDPEDITFFKSLGVAIEDVAVAALVYEKAKAQGVGAELPIA